MAVGWENLWGAGLSLFADLISQSFLNNVFINLFSEGSCESSAREGPLDSLSILICDEEARISYSKMK